MKTLLVGSSGTLGGYLQKYFDCDCPSHSELDITKYVKRGQYDLVIHAGAYTDVIKAETDRWKCYQTNVVGTFNLVKAYPDTPFVYISSEYAKNPVNFYSWTKLGGEIAVKAVSSSYLIIRTLFKPVPFPFERAFDDQWTSGDEVSVIAPMIVCAISFWDRKSKTIAVGTGRKRIIDIARKSKPDILPCSIKQVKGVALPQDTSDCL